MHNRFNQTSPNMDALEAVWYDSKKPVVARFIGSNLPWR